MRHLLKLPGTGPTDGGRRPEVVEQSLRQSRPKPGNQGEGQQVEQIGGGHGSIVPIREPDATVFWSGGGLDSDGLDWAVLFNTDVDPKGKNLTDLIDPKLHQAADAVKKWPYAD